MDKNQKVKITETSFKTDDDAISTTEQIDGASEKKPPKWFGKLLRSSLIVALAYGHLGRPAGCTKGSCLLWRLDAQRV